MMEAQQVGFRILALSATPVSKIENLPTIIHSLRTSKLEVRDEDDEEVRGRVEGHGLPDLVS